MLTLARPTSTETATARRRAALIIDRERRSIERRAIAAGLRIGATARMAAYAAWRTTAEVEAVINAVHNAMNGSPRLGLPGMAPVLAETMVAADLTGRRRASIIAGPMLTGQGGFRLASSAHKMAIRWLRTRVALTDGQFARLREAYDPPAIRLVRVASGQLERAIRRKMVTLTRVGSSARQGIVALREVFETEGFAPAKDYTLEAIFRTETQTAYAAGRYAVQQDPAIDDILWGFEYAAITDDRVTEDICLPMNGVVRRKSDPVWERLTPPNHWSCRSTVLELFSPQRETETLPNVRAQEGFGYHPGLLFRDALQQTGQAFSAANCGTGAGGFKPGNTCATGKGSTANGIGERMGETTPPEELLEPKAVTVTGYRGQTRSGNAGAYHGIGTYYSLDRKGAERFSKEGTVVASEVHLDAACIIKSDADLKLLKQQAEFELRQLYPARAREIDFGEKGNLYEGGILPSMTEVFTRWMIGYGFDGIVIDYREAGGGRQIVKFPKLSEIRPMRGSLVLNCGTGAGGFKPGNKCAANRILIGKGNSGEVFREGNEAVKKAKRADGSSVTEGEIYEKLAGVEGVAPGYEKDGEIRTPFYQEVMSIDTVPDARDRESMGGVVAKNAKRLLNGMNGLSELGIDYNDPLQVGYDDDFNANIIDFGNAGKADSSENAYRANIDRVTDYLETFGATVVAEKVSTTFQAFTYAKHVSSNDAANTLRRVTKQADAGRPFAVHLKSAGAEKIAGYDVKYAYYANNPRHVDVPDAIQSEQHEGVKVLLSRKPIDDDIIRQYDLMPVIHPAKRAKGSRLALANCGTGSGGFKPGNTCATGNDDSDNVAPIDATSRVPVRFSDNDTVLMKRVNAVMEELDITMADLPDLVGAPDDSTIEIQHTTGRSEISAKVSAPGWSSSRTIRANGTITNEFFYLDEDRQGMLQGTESFAQQVRAAAESGMTDIFCQAERGPKSVGYYVWPRLGYDGDLSESRNFETPFRKSGEAWDRDYTRVSEYMMTPQGRDYWKANGQPIPVRFRLDEGSLSLRVFRAYLAGKGLTLSNTEEIGDELDDAILDRIWDEIGRERGMIPEPLEIKPVPDDASRSA